MVANNTSFAFNDSAIYAINEANRLGAIQRENRDQIGGFLADNLLDLSRNAGSVRFPVRGTAGVILSSTTLGTLGRMIQRGVTAERFNAVLVNTIMASRQHIAAATGREFTIEQAQAMASALSSRFTDNMVVGSPGVRITVNP